MSTLVAPTPTPTPTPDSTPAPDDSPAMAAMNDILQRGGTLNGPYSVKDGDKSKLRADVVLTHNDGRVEKKSLKVTQEEGDALEAFAYKMQVKFEKARKQREAERRKQGPAQEQGREEAPDYEVDNDSARTTTTTKLSKNPAQFVHGSELEPGGQPLSST